MIEGSSFSGLLTRVEIGDMRIRSAGKGRIKSRGWGEAFEAGAWGEPCVDVPAMRRERRCGCEHYKGRNVWLGSPAL
jgi:hypothetical protein